MAVHRCRKHQHKKVVERYVESCHGHKTLGVLWICDGTLFTVKEESS